MSKKYTRLLLEIACCMCMHGISQEIRLCSIQYSFSLFSHAMSGIYTLCKVYWMVSVLHTFWPKSHHKHIEFVANRKMFACWLSCHYRKHQQNYPDFNRKYVCVRLSKWKQNRRCCGTCKIYSDSVIENFLLIFNQNYVEPPQWHTIRIYAFYTRLQISWCKRGRRWYWQEYIYENTWKWSKNTTQSK